MKNKEFLNNKAAEIHAAIIKAEPYDLPALCEIVARHWPDFRVYPVLYFGSFQGYGVKIYNAEGTTKQVNPIGTAYAALKTDEILMY